MIKIKCDYISGAVAIPTEVIDKHLKLAPVASFKVLLFIFRNPDCSADSEQISVCTGLSRQDVEDMMYNNAMRLIDGARRDIYGE